MQERAEQIRSSDKKNDLFRGAAGAPRKTRGLVLVIVRRRIRREAP
jgi:hypothetical protein